MLFIVVEMWKRNKKEKPATRKEGEISCRCHKHSPQKRRNVIKPVCDLE